MKQLSCIGHVDNLRAQIRHDLRELGIKVPKPKKSKRGGPKLHQVITLENLCTRTAQSSRGVRSRRVLKIYYFGLL